ncbi:MAG: DUF2281 domain-containing protein [Leptolyngbyaceae cyanobacterium CAN_BIN12]|nr:DUF2281 domain-containing protein [Leptolyngbyaceae cyanobacterium CAN_BIN12]
MQPVQQKVLEALQNLSPLEQQEVLDFAEFLESRREPIENNEQPGTTAVSFLDAARKYIGCLEGGPPDLSTNQAYMEGFGET